MVKLSNYSEGYESGKQELMPWEFWTEEERSHVINQAYKQRYLTSKEVKPYLSASATHMITQYLGPILSGVFYFGFLKTTFALPLYRRSPTIGFVAGAAFVTVSSILWVNLSPFYLKKQTQQERTLDVIYHKIGTSMKQLNELIPRTRTSTDIDLRTRFEYFKRNGIFSETLFAGDDFAPPILTKRKHHKYDSKNIYL